MDFGEGECGGAAEASIMADRGLISGLRAGAALARTLATLDAARTMQMEDYEHDERHNYHLTSGNCWCALPRAQAVQTSL